MSFKCIICKRRIEGAIHVEPEGYYHPECFEKTEKGRRVKLMSEISRFILEEYAEEFATKMLPKVKEKFKYEIEEQKLTDEDLKTIIKSRFRLI